VQRLGRPEHLAAQTVGDHHVVTHRHFEHQRPSPDRSPE
jgi:hypothetical protein